MLPIDAVLPALCDALREGTEAVLAAPPGAGKTTRAPLALKDEPWARTGKLIVLAPRRLAARAAAARMAAQMGDRVGGEIGYRVRLDSQVSARTRVEVVTEGVFTRMVLDDPALAGICGVLFDEFHERSLEGDLALALARDAQQGLRPELRLLVMSATLDVDRVSTLLGGAPTIVSEGRMFPVVVNYAPRDAAKTLEADMAALIARAMRGAPGDVLAFLPGAREIERTASALRDRIDTAATDVFPLYAALGPEAQDAAVAPARDGRRKIVLATSIAETSLTIEGVRIVVDSGLARRPRFEPGLGLSRLETTRASQAAITQRAGRAGRVAEGVCWRLWSEGETRALPAFDRPEILDADLSGLALTLSAWGVADPESLSWLDPPPKPAWARAVAELERIGARDSEGRLTPYGARAAQMPLSPSLAHMVLQAGERGAGARAAHLAVALTEQGLGGDTPDLEARLQRWAREDHPRARNARALAARIAKAAGSAGMDGMSLGAIAALAFPDRIAKARGKDSGAFLMANGRACALDPAEPLARAGYLVVADATGRADRARILAATELSAEEVEGVAGEAMETRDEIALDVDTGAVRARRSKRLGAIVLSEAPLARVSDDAIAAAILAHVRATGVAGLPWTETDAHLRARVAFLRALEPDAWPDWRDAALMETLDAWLAPALIGASSLRELGDGRLGDALENTLGYAARRVLAQEAPTHFDTPAGGRVAIDYACEGAPAVDVRLQEFFGEARHPAIAGGRAPLLLRLLSPAQRPIQTTRDLPGFWRGSYAGVRADMRGRYPKHPWPEDPLAAAPTRRAKPKGA